MLLVMAIKPYVFISRVIELAEINGIGLDTDADLSSNWFYMIYRTQNWGIK